MGRAIGAALDLALVEVGGHMYSNGSVRQVLHRKWDVGSYFIIGYERLSNGGHEEGGLTNLVQNQGMTVP